MADDLQRQIEQAELDAKRLGSQLDSTLEHLEQLREQQRIAGMTPDQRRRLWRIVQGGAAAAGITAAVDEIRRHPTTTLSIVAMITAVIIGSMIFSGPEAGKQPGGPNPPPLALVTPTPSPTTAPSVTPSPIPTGMLTAVPTPDGGPPEIGVSPDVGEVIAAPLPPVSSAPPTMDAPAPDEPPTQPSPPEPPEPPEPEPSPEPEEPQPPPETELPPEPEPSPEPTPPPPPDDDEEWLLCASVDLVEVDLCVVNLLNLRPGTSPHPRPPR